LTFNITVPRAITVEFDGDGDHEVTETDNDGDLCWEDASECVCEQCKLEGRVADFEEGAAMTEQIRNQLEKRYHSAQEPEDGLRTDLVLSRMPDDELLERIQVMYREDHPEQFED
jgi:hypothetical protein